jgi:hypothetical protein
VVGLYDKDDLDAIWQAHANLHRFCCVADGYLQNGCGEPHESCPQLVIADRVRILEPTTDRIPLRTNRDELSRLAAVVPDQGMDSARCSRTRSRG